MSKTPKPTGQALVLEALKAGEALTALDALQRFGVFRLAAVVHELRRRGLDNVLKGLLDAMQHSGLIADDGNIDILSIVRANPIQGGRLVVHLSDAGVARAQWLDLLTISRYDRTCQVRLPGPAEQQ